ncbi:Hpr(Ser) kinase/phosphatase [Marivita geojedonensis]|nr:Hpr(Ser) kinase/phosphatase [Marivita geojedonensis]
MSRLQRVRDADLKAKRYRSAGLVIESEFELPGLVEEITGLEHPQLSFVHASRKPSYPRTPKMTGLNWACDETTFHFVVPDVAVFEISADGTVSVWPQSEAHDDVAAYLIGSVLGIVLHMRKVVTLHASAVDIGGRAVLFCGESGAGKSTMAAALQRHGFKVLCDDICAVELTTDGAIAHSDGRKLKLWQQSIKMLEITNGVTQPVLRGLDKYYVESGLNTKASASILEVVELTRVPGPAMPRIVALPSSEAAAVVRSQAYRPFLVQELGDEALYFEAAVSILRQAKVYRLERAYDFDQINTTIALLQEHWLSSNQL